MKGELLSLHPRQYVPSSTDCAVGWAWDVEVDGAPQTILVELAGTAANSRAIADEARRAIRDCGRAAVRRALAAGELPARIVISTDGVRAAA